MLKILKTFILLTLINAEADNYSSFHTSYVYQKRLPKTGSD